MDVTPRRVTKCCLRPAAPAFVPNRQNRLITSIRGVLGLVLGLGVFCAASCSGSELVDAKPVSFDFIPPENAAVKNPFARELWGEITTPSGKMIVLPAYFAGKETFTVHARPDEQGLYRLSRVSETTSGAAGPDLSVRMISARELNNPAALRLPAIRRDPHNHRLLQRTDGQPYFPVGANLAWAPTSDPVDFYCRAFPAFARAHLNWMRVWMAHWGGLNLDWLARNMGPSPRPGGIDFRVADRWDRLLAAAMENGVYIQIVLQHHGQFSTGTNSNWADNPWNAVQPGGFLAAPRDFFTDAHARLLTRLKYRYIVARWGWSPAIAAWELFNEVHWTDAYAHGHESDVARWHSDMADYLRSIDAYGHLVTTSTEKLRSRIYEKMDYYQPHQYAANLLAAARSTDPSADTLDRPIFYGEVGDDHLPVTDKVKESGLTILPGVWASLMGQGTLAAQPWEGWQLFEQKRLGELGAVAHFLKESGLSRQNGLTAFSPLVECDSKVPFALVTGQVWQRRPALELEVPLDGREILGFGQIPGAYVGTTNSLEDAFPSRATYHIDFPRDMTLQVRVVGIDVKGGTLRISVDGQTALEKTWPAATKTLSNEKPAVLPFAVPAGRHTLVVENPAAGGWFELAGIDFPQNIPLLAAIGRRHDSFITVWLWHRTNLYALRPAAPVSGTLLLDDVPAGTWHVTWWDTVKGIASAPTVVEHPGGVLRLPTPPVSRHAAVVLTR